MKGLREDLKHALRLYRRTPATSLMAVFVLAVGMAFVASFLSLYADLILRPEPGFERGGRIISVGWNDGRNAGGLPLDLIDRIAGESTTLAHIAGVTHNSFQAGSNRENVLAEVVTNQFFPGIRPTLALGRGFSEEEHQQDGEPVVVLSWRYWQEQFDGRADVIGETIPIDSRRFTMPGAPQTAAAEVAPPIDFRIIGVMGRDYQGALPPGAEAWVRFWMPVERSLNLRGQIPAATLAMMRSNMNARGLSRRADGVSNEAVKSELESRFSDAEFMQRPGTRYDAIDGIIQNVFIHRATQRQLQLFLGASVLLALVAAANVSLFLLARAPGRRRELGIRMAVGAPLRRLVRQLASEAALLVLAASALGLGLSLWLAQFLRGLPFLRQAQFRDVTMLDWRVLVMTGVFLLLVTLLVSLAPVLGLKKLGIAASSRLVTARATLAQRIAGTAQVAIAGVLGGAAIAFAWYLASTLLSDPGYRTQNLHAVQFGASEGSRVTMSSVNGQVIISGMVDSAIRRDAFAAVPGVTAVSVAGGVPGMNLFANSLSMVDPADPQQAVRVNSIEIDSNYAGMMGLQLVDGTNITDDDNSSALVNQTFARLFFGRDQVAGEPMPPLQWAMPQSGSPSRIAGVVKDLPYGHPLGDIDPLVMSISGGTPYGSLALVESALPVAVLQKQFQDMAMQNNFALYGNVSPLLQLRHDLLAPDRARGWLTIGTAAIVVLLAALGFYGTLKYLVTAGRREYAIRASLGAGPRSLGRLVFQRGLLLGLPGLALGAPLAFILVAWLRDDYISRDISPLAVTALVVVAMVVLLLLAATGPARMARSTQPAPLLRED